MRDTGWIVFIIIWYVLPYFDLIPLAYGTRPRGVAAAAIEKNLGLTLTKARRSIDRIVVDLPQASNKQQPPRNP